MRPEEQRLLQAIQFFQERNKGAEMPEGLHEALNGLSEVLGGNPARDASPGQKEAAKAAPGTTGTGETFSKAALGRDGVSPGQRAAKGESGGFEITVQPTT